MKSYYTLIGLLLSIATYGQQTIVFQETFETSSVFTAPGECADGFLGSTQSIGYDYFTRTTSGGGPNGANGSRIKNKNVYKNPEGSYFWAANDINGCGENRNVETLEKIGIDISGKTTNLSLVLLVAEDDEDIPTNQKWDNDTHVFVEVKIDGDSYVKVLQFSAGADADSSADDMEPKLDTNLDGTGDGIAVTNTFQEFRVDLSTFSGLDIPSSALTLDLKITFDKLDTGGEDFAIDNIRIVQNYLAPVAPVINNNGGSDVASIEVPENTTAVTTVEATDANGDTISYGIDDSSPDANKFTITPKADGTGAYLIFTNAPDFETPASSVGSNVYMVVVRVNSGTGTALCCKTQAITVTVTDDVNEIPATEEVVFQETFETESVSFTASETCTDGGYDFFTRTTSGAGDGGDNGTRIASKNVYINPEGYYFWATQDTNGSPCTMAVQTLEKTGIPISGKTTNLSLVLLAAEDDEDIPTNQKWDNDTHVFVEVKIDGGSYVKVLQFSAGADSDSSADDMEPKLDTNLDGTGDGTTITDTFQEFRVDLSSFSGLTIPSSASTLDLKITFDKLDAGGEDFAIDNIRIVQNFAEVQVAPVITSNGGGDTASVNVDENTTRVTTVTATDANRGTISYDIDPSSSDASKFTIDTSTGVLTFVAPPDFETPTSSASSNVYMVVVKASDTSSLFDTQTITVNVENVENDGTIVFQETFETESVSFTASETCTDGEYDYFTRTTSGAGDGGDNGTRITNKNVYRNPEGSYFWATQDTNGSPCTMAVQTLEKTGIPISGKTTNLSLVLLAAEDDEDIPTNQKWDNDTHVFVEVKIDGGSYVKVLQFSAGADSDSSADDMEPKLDTNLDGTGDGTTITDTFQEFRVDLSSFSGLTIPSSASTLDLKITFDKLDAGGEDFAIDNIRIVSVPVAPVISGGDTAVKNIPENTTAVTTVEATDTSGNGITYSITGGADASKFTINPSTGALAFTDEPDFENPTGTVDSSDANKYEVIVKASDGTLSDTQTITVTVTDVDESPEITSNGGGDTAVKNIPENTTAVTTVEATDSDGDTITYSITGGADASKFTITPKADGTGANLAFTDEPDFENPTGTVDSSDANKYEVIVKASDGALSDTQTITVTVTDVDESPEIISNGGGDTAVKNIPEKTTAVTTVEATDSDGDTITYSITGGADASKFTITPKADGTGANLAFTDEPDFENPTGTVDSSDANKYEVIVKASDGTLSDTQTITVTVTDVDESPEIISNGGGDTAVKNIPEKTTAVTTVEATDSDGDTITYSITGGADASKFTITPKADGTGANLAFTDEPDFENPTGTVDSSDANKYEVIVKASDGTLSDTQTITVTVTDVDESPEIISNGGGDTAVKNIPENTTAVTTVEATDSDGDTITYSITGGADASKFTITPKADGTGANLAFTDEPDFENPTGTVDSSDANKYEVIVKASDGTLSDTQTITVTVTDVDESPEIISNGGGDTAVKNIPENTTAVTTVEATDSDGDTITYSITGGADASKFTITPKADGTGANLAFTDEPDFENPTGTVDSSDANKYEVIVTASDGTLSDTQTITVTVTDVDESPEITSNGGGDTAVKNIPEKTTAVTTVEATDSDGDTITYSITGGADANKFTINPSTGALAFTDEPDFENPTGTVDSSDANKYEVIVTASDGTLSDTQTITVTVTDVDESPEITSNGGGDTAVKNIPENTTAVTTVEATDSDGDTITYSITGGADASKFTINPSTGALAFATEPDFENPTGTVDSSDANKYKVIVTASDGTLSDTQTITITVTDVDDTTMSVDENTITSSVRIYPNPSGDFILLPNITGKYSIYNISGKEVLKGIISTTKKIDIRNLMSGLYFLKINNSRTLKFLKK